MTDSFDSGEGFVKLGRREATQEFEYVDEPEQLPGPSTFGQVLDQGLELLRDNFLMLSLASGSLTLLTTFVMRAAYFAGPSADDEMPKLLWMSMVMLALLTLLGSLLVGVSAVLGVAGFQEGWAKRRGFAALRGANLWSGAFTSLLVGLIVAAGLVVIFPLGFYLGFRLTYATTAACYERVGPLRAVARSWVLTRKSDRLGEWLGLLACVTLLASIPLGMASAMADASLAQAIGDLLGMDLSSTDYLLEPIAAYLMGLGTALGAAVFGRFQLDLLARREGLDLRRRLEAGFATELAR
ncbi:MAG: hypothetical protein H6831_04215 [Planctomycetes bacterium]|nr:hypothetical protein [Planctomycetota bacterium]MCB9903592.1 hypothetical protein [Planctomycetota bacterium]